METKEKKKCLLSLALIMRDAAEDILTCLNSVAGAVDEMVIVDTGSVDGSVKLVRKFLRQWQAGAPHRRGKLSRMEWRDDFALAKNHALARCHGEYVLFLDSDESLSEDTRGNLRPLVEAFARGEMPQGVKRVKVPGEGSLPEGFDLLELWRRNVELTGEPVFQEPEDLAVRLLKRQEGLRYQGEVHEQLVFATGQKTRLAVADKNLLTLLHTGYRAGLKEEKKRRNMEILMKEEQQGGSTFLLDYYLAEAHLYQKHWRQAIECAHRCLRGSLPVHDRLAPYRIAYQAFRELEQEACQRAGLNIGEGEKLPEPAPGESEALQSARALRRQGEEVMTCAIEAFPDYPEFYYFRGGRRWNAGDKEQGKADLEKALALSGSFREKHPEDDFRFAELLPGLQAALAQVRKEMEAEQRED